MPAHEPLIATLSEDTPCSTQFNDFYPPPPYFHLLTSFEELKTSPLEPLLCALHEIRSPALGFYQCLFQPVQREHNWHANVEFLHDLEYGLKLQSGLGVQSHFQQQLPSGDLRGMALEVERKAHNDKPFFCAAVRIGLAREERSVKAQLLSLSTPMGLFQHGGKALRQVEPEQYRLKDTSDLIQKGMTYRPGFLVNARELAGFVHVFSTTLLEARQIRFETLETLPIKDEKLNDGTVIGVSHFGELVKNVCIPHDLRACGTHILGSPGTGKTTVMINMFLQDIAKGTGAAFIDAHGDAVKDLLGLIPAEHIHRRISFNPGDPQWIPSWNPIYVPPGGDIYRMTNNFLSAFERISKDWGDRLAHVLRNGLIGLSSLKQATLQDLLNLVRQKSPESEALRKQIIQLTTDDTVRHFWERDFLKDYRASDLASPKHKLTPLIGGSESVRLMVSQPSGAIQFRQIMDEGKILLVDLSGLGSETQEVLVSLILSLFLMATISRSDLEASERRPFSIFADEAHLFVSADAIENMIAQARKFCVGLCIAHQYKNQFKSETADALSSVGSAIFGRLDKRDSQYFSKDLQDLVEPKDLVSLKAREMIARIGTEVVRIRTLPCQRSPDATVRARIIENSHRHYCRPADEVRRLIANRSERLKESLGFSEECPFSPEDLTYEEF